MCELKVKTLCVEKKVYTILVGCKEKESFLKYKVSRSLGKVLHPVPHTGSLLVGEHNFLGTEFFGKEDTGNLGAVNTGPFQFAVRKVDAAKVGLPEIASAEIHPFDFETAKIDAPKITVGEIGFLSGLKPGIELADLPITQQFIHGIGRQFRLHLEIFRGDPLLETAFSGPWPCLNKVIGS